MVITERPIEEIDKQILVHLDSGSSASPKDISENRLRENVIRIRCWRLKAAGLLEEVTHDIYSLTERGREVNISEFIISEYISDTVTLSPNRITELIELDPEDIKWRNREYFENPDHRYDFGTFLSHDQVDHRISVVRNGDLNRVMNEFPRDEELSKQCAHWVRAIVGLHFFHDANHRTAMATLNTLLQLNDIERFEWGEEDDRYMTAIFKSKLIRKHVINVRFDNLWSKDELYLLWHRYFATRFYDIAEYNHHSPDYERIEDIPEGFSTSYSLDSPPN